MYKKSQNDHRMPKNAPTKASATLKSACFYPGVAFCLIIRPADSLHVVTFTHKPSTVKTYSFAAMTDGEETNHAALKSVYKLREKSIWSY